MIEIIRFKRGNKANLPSLQLGEPAITQDTNELYVGMTSGNVKIPTQPDLDSVNTSLAENIQQKGTTQSIVFNTDGTIQKVQYKDSNGNVLREDTFTYATNLITEVRTVGSSSTTYKYHLDTLQTEVI